MRWHEPYESKCHVRICERLGVKFPGLRAFPVALVLVLSIAAVAAQPRPRSERACGGWPYVTMDHSILNVNDTVPLPTAGAGKKSKPPG